MSGHDPHSEPEIIGSQSDAQLTDQLLSSVWSPRAHRWWLAFLIAAAVASLLFAFATWTVWTGIGLWGNNIPVGWAFGIVNFVWWVGIGHAGTFISAILLLFEQRWRTSINRFAEAMTLFAVVQAGLFPILHLGRPWFFYWLIPYPSTMGLWPNFKSALPWDVAAVATYLSVSFLFWYLGLVPDLATLRDRAPRRSQKIVYGIFALGWRGSASHWRHYRIAYGLLAGLATPLVISVHSVVSSDFATSIVPGWHSTLFPPYFVAGAIFSGFGMVLTLLIPVRRIFKMQNVITRRHLDAMAKMTLATGLIVAYSYICELFLAWYSGDEAEMYTALRGLTSGPNYPVFWLTILCNCIIPQLLWARRVRMSEPALWLLSIAVNVGMWSERFSIIIMSLQRDFLPSAWHAYTPTFVDWGILAGTMGFFALLFITFLRFVPFVPLAEVKELAKEMRH